MLVPMTSARRFRDRRSYFATMWFQTPVFFSMYVATLIGLSGAASASLLHSVRKKASATIGNVNPIHDAKSQPAMAFGGGWGGRGTD